MLKQHLRWSLLVFTALFAKTTCDTDHAEENYAVGGGDTPEALRYSPQGLDFGILAWVHNTEGGYYNPKQEFRTEDPNDPTSLTGVFAKERIEDGELLCRVPSTIWIIGERDERDSHPMCCGLVRKLAHHMRLGDQSEFALYMRYINAQPENQIPSVWSTHAQELLLKIIGVTRDQSEMFPNISKLFPPSSVVSWIETEWYGTCRGNPDDHVEKKAALMSIFRTDDELMIPAYDFYNHRNGEWHNADSENDGQFYETRAWRTIEPGEQIFISYNRCPLCSGRTTEYGAAELFRDYGFIENFPQHWHYYKNEIAFDLHYHEKDLNDSYYEVEWISMPAGNRVVFLTFWMQQQVRRLERLWHMIYKSQNHEESGISKQEWNMIWTFHEANLLALKCAISAMNGSNRISIETVNSTATMENLYHDFEFQSDDLWHSVDMQAPRWELEGFYAYPSIDSESNILQTIDISAAESPSRNVCMYRNDKLHVCSSFRPPYYEYFVHPAASLLPSVRRVLIVGNGAAFLLHEVMKYTATLELVVVIERDRTVTLMAHKHFHVDSHFNDSRVEWWFGDTNEVLSLVSTIYRGSFDLVLLDIDKPALPIFRSRTTKVSEFVHEGGILVSHDDYMDEMGHIFAYSSRLINQCTTRSRQIHTLGSHSVDFLRAVVNDHGIDALIYDPLLMSTDRLLLLQDFERFSQAVFTAITDQEEDYIPTDVAVGFLNVVEITNMTESPNDTISSLREVLEQHNFTYRAVIEFSSTESIVIRLKEGYIIARRLESHDYVALDIFLRKQTSRLSLLTAAIVEKLGTVISSFRIVPGGIQQYGPRLTDSEPICHLMNHKPVSPLMSSNIDVYDTILRVVGKTFVPTSINVLVICEILLNCPVRNMIQNLHFVESHYALELCSAVSVDENDSSKSLLDSMIACDGHIQDWISKNLVTNKISIDVVILDGGLSRRSLQVLDRILNFDSRTQQSWISRACLFLTLPTNLDLCMERRSFSDRFFQNLGPSDGVKADFIVTDRDGKKLSDFSVSSRGVGDVRLDMLELEDLLNKELGKSDMQVLTQRMRGGSIWHRKLLPMRPVDDGDYEQELRDSDKSKSTEPVAAQDVVRIKTTDGVPPDREYLEDIVMLSLQSSGMEQVQKVAVILDNETIPDILAFEFNGGNLLITLYGNSVFDLNMFSFNDSPEVNDRMDEFAANILMRNPTWKFLWLNTLPRGPGEVMLLETSEEEHWLDEENDDE